MRRRDLLNAGLAAAATLAAPRIARADSTKTLRFVPTSDLAVLDPVVTFKLQESIEQLDEKRLMDFAAENTFEDEVGLGIREYWPHGEILSQATA